MENSTNDIVSFYTLGLEIAFNFLRYFIPALLVFLLFYVIFKKFFNKWKVQKEYPKNAQIQSEIVFSTLTLLVFCCASWLVFTFIDWGWTLIYLSYDTYSWLYLVLSFPLLVIIHDTYFYWTHRLLHAPAFFKLAHLRHHLSHNPTPWSAFSFHPIEAIINALFLPIIVVIMPLHPLIIFCFMLLMTLVNIMGHAGFEFFSNRFVNSTIGKWSNAVQHHNYHHEHSDGNYGLYFTFWDRWMGTFKK